MEFQNFILEESKKDYYKKLFDTLNEEYENYTCYPARNSLFHAFQLTPFENVKVVIFGQDPYHEPNQAHGLAFSVLCDKLPPSLKNIYKEMESDLGKPVNQNGDLTYLAKQGVLLLNTVLSVREGQANSHKNIGWQEFTDNVIKKLNEIDRPIVFILWGSQSINKKKLLNNPKHFIIESNHPSPLSAYRGFFGSKPFSKTNEFLKSKGLEEINWINN